MLRMEASVLHVNIRYSRTSQLVASLLAHSHLTLVPLQPQPSVAVLAADQQDEPPHVLLHLVLIHLSSLALVVGDARADGAPELPRSGSAVKELELRRAKRVAKE